MDEGPVAKEIFQREVVDVRPGGRTLPGHFQPLSVGGSRVGPDALGGVWFH